MQDWETIIFITGSAAIYREQMLTNSRIHIYIVNESEIQSRFYVHFHANILRKVMGERPPIMSFYKDEFSIK